MHGRLDRDAGVLVDQCAQRELKLMRPRIFPDTFAHGVFLWPPCKATR